MTHVVIFPPSPIFNVENMIYHFDLEFNIELGMRVFWVGLRYYAKDFCFNLTTHKNKNKMKAVVIKSINLRKD